MVDTFQRNRSFKTKLQIRFIVKSIKCVLFKINFISISHSESLPESQSCWVSTEYFNFKTAMSASVALKIALFSSRFCSIKWANLLKSIKWPQPFDFNLKSFRDSCSLPSTLNDILRSCSCHVVVKFYQPFCMARFQRQ